MLDKCGEGTRYIYRKQFKSALVPNNLSVAYVNSSPYNTWWSNLSEEDKRRKGVRYDILARHTNQLIPDLGVYTVRYFHQVCSKGRLPLYPDLGC